MATCWREHQRPMLVIHASDMATLSRFEFNQFQFDFLCSDLSQLPIATASASSAALPLVLSPVSLKNHAGTCGFEPPQVWRKRREMAESVASEPTSICPTSMLEAPLCAPARRRPFDNIALRSIMEASGTIGGLEQLLKFVRVKNVRKFVILTVNAETSPM